MSRFLEVMAVSYEGWIEDILLMCESYALDLDLAIALFTHNDLYMFVMPHCEEAEHYPILSRHDVRICRAIQQRQSRECVARPYHFTAKHDHELIHSACGCTVFESSYLVKIALGQIPRPTLSPTADIARDICTDMALLNDVPVRGTMFGKVTLFTRAFAGREDIQWPLLPMDDMLTMFVNQHANFEVPERNEDKEDTKESPMWTADSLTYSMDTLQTPRGAPTCHSPHQPIERGGSRDKPQS